MEVTMKSKPKRTRDGYYPDHNAQWVMQLRLAPGTALGVHPPLNLSIKTSLPQAVEATRRNIVEVQTELARLRGLPMKRESQLQAISARLAGLSQWAQPKIGFDAKGFATVRWYEEMATMDQVLALFTFVLGPEQVAAAFARDLDEEREDAVSPLEREQQIRN
jgi:hypothetical protein